jgi:hypothetical protein
MKEWFGDLKDKPNGRARLPVARCWRSWVPMSFAHSEQHVRVYFAAAEKSPRQRPRSSRVSL